MSSLRGGEELLNQEARRLLGPFGFTPPQKREMWEAFKASPDGVERCAEHAKVAGRREGRSGAGLLLAMVRSGDHLRVLEPDARRVTGWRFVRGSHSGTFVEDPAGTDPLPPGYDFVTRSRVGHEPAEDDLPTTLDLQGFGS
jgi:hypothetical protein